LCLNFLHNYKILSNIKGLITAPAVWKNNKGCKWEIYY